MESRVLFPLQCLVGLLGAALFFPTLGFSQTAGDHQPGPPEGWVLVAEDVFLGLPAEVWWDFHDARRQLATGNPEEAAASIRKAAAIVLFEGRREQNADLKQGLMESVLDLELLAAAIVQRTVASPNALAASFARADFVLARHHLAAARDGLKQDAPLKTGYELRSAGTHFQSSVDWLRVETPEASLDATAQALKAADDLIGGIPVADGRVAGAIAVIEEGLGGLGPVIAALPMLKGEPRRRWGAAPLPAPEGYVLVEEDVWLGLSDEVGTMLHTARAALAARQYARAASDIRRALAVVKIERDSTRYPLVRKALQQSAWALDALAGDIEKGKITTSLRLDRASAQAHHALAWKYQLDARDAWAKRHPGRTARALHSALTHLRHGLVWVGHDLETGAADLAAKAEALSEQLERGAGSTEREVEDSIEFLRQQIEGLRERL